MTSKDVIERLSLQPLPEEGGYYRQTWQSAESSAIYFLLTPENNGFSALHTLSSVEIYHFYAGDSVQLLLFPPEGTPGEVQEVILGCNLEKEEYPQFAVPAGTTQGSCLMNGGEWALLGTTMAPPYSQERFKLSSRSKMLKTFPDYRDWIVRLTREEED